jgi:hypothetical protein
MSRKTLAHLSALYRTIKNEWIQLSTVLSIMASCATTCQEKSFYLLCAGVLRLRRAFNGRVAEQQTQ